MSVASGMGSIVELIATVVEFFIADMVLDGGLIISGV